MRALLLILLCTLVSAPLEASPKSAKKSAKKNAAQRADIVVIAELIRSPGGLPHCGVLAVVGEYEFRVTEVKRGKLDEERIVVEALCPEMSMQTNHLSRLELLSKRRFRYQPMQPLDKPPTKRLYLFKQEPLKFDYTELLGTTLRSVKAQFTQTSEGEEGWVSFGPGLDIQTMDKRVTRLRLACPPGFPRAFAWLGLPKVEWQTYRRRGGFSEGRFTAPEGIVGAAKRGRIEFGLAHESM